MRLIVVRLGLQRVRGLFLAVLAVCHRRMFIIKLLLQLRNTLDQRSGRKNDLVLNGRHLVLLCALGLVAAEPLLGSVVLGHAHLVVDQSAA